MACLSIPVTDVIAASDTHVAGGGLNQPNKLCVTLCEYARPSATTFRIVVGSDRNGNVLGLRRCARQPFLALHLPPTKDYKRRRSVPLDGGNLDVASTRDENRALRSA